MDIDREKYKALYEYQKLQFEDESKNCIATNIPDICQLYFIKCLKVLGDCWLLAPCRPFML